MKRSLIIWIVAAATPAAAKPETAGEVTVTAAPPIAAAPANLDPDVAARLDEAARAAATAPPDLLDRALDRVLIVYESDDPFSLAQRDRALPRSLEVLTTIGTRARAAGKLELAARAFDARWTLSGHTRRDPDLAAALTAWGERDAARAPSEALYLARRARKADPTFTAAAHLDDDLSSNHRIWPARLAVIAGLVAFGVGVYAQVKVISIEDDLTKMPHSRAEIDRMIAQRDTYDAIGVAGYIAAPTLSITGMLLALSGIPHETPASPAALPTVEDR
jgi:hypothetical protein